MDKILKEFGKEKIEEVVGKSNSFVEATKMLGLDPYRGNVKRNVERSIKRLGLSTEHFESVQRVREYQNRYKKDILEKLIKDGKNFKEILEELDILVIGSNYNTLKKYLRKFDIDYSHLRNSKSYIKANWEKENLEKIISESKSQKEVLEKMGLRAAGSNFSTLKKYIELYELNTSHFIKCYNKMAFLSKENKIPLNDILKENSTYNRTGLKIRLYEDGLKKRKCELCGQGEEWNGKHMSLILDHINGVYNDNRIENLQIVCPNCNATLDTHCGKNTKEKIKNKIEQKEKNKINSFISRRRVERPPFEKLKEEVNKIGLESVGRKYGVSGNAIKKWIKTYQKYNI